MEYIFYLLLILEYYSKKDKLIKNRIKMAINDNLTGCFFDFLTTLPFNTSNYHCKYFPNQICHTYEKNNINNYLVILIFLKSIKIFKITANKKN